MICDVCLVERAELWGFPVAGFHEPFSDTTNKAGEWAICDDCRPLLEAGDSQGLALRVSIIDSAIVAGIVERFYALVIRHITGPLIRCSDQSTPLYGGSS